MAALNRRTVLRGAINGAAVTVGLPFLDCFLNGNGTALAATGAALPVTFGSWIQGLGFNPGMWIPDKTGAGFKNNVQLQVFDPLRAKMNVVSGTKYFLDGHPLETHTTPLQIATTGGIPTGTISGPSIDAVIADTIGKKTRFRSLEVNFSGSRQSWSQRSGTSKNPCEMSPVALYARVFGPEFRDPNAAEFKPDPQVMVHKSVLSAVSDQRQSVVSKLGASDKARLDEYFTALREMEGQLDIELQKPTPMPSCTAPGKPDEVTPSSVVEDASQNAKLFGALIAHAIACDQTRVFNVNVGSQGLRHRGKSQNWHIATHEEAIDEKLGYQKEVFGFITWANQVCFDFLTTLDTMKEGGGSVLDRTVMLWQTDHADARSHSLDLMPILMWGGAGGRLKTGLHIAAPADPVTRAGLTVMQALGAPMNVWGELSNRTTRPFTELLA